MLRKVLILLGFFVFALFASAQEIVRDSVFSDSEYHLKLDSVPSPETDKTELLKSRKHFAKVDFLNDFQLNTKSGEGDNTFKWTLDSIVVQDWNKDSQSIEKSLRQVLISQSNGLEMLVKNYNWNEDKNHWLIGDANYYFFNESDRLDSVEFQEYVTVNYRMFTKTYYSYQDGLLASEWSEEKFDEYDDWGRLDRIDYEYDEQNRLYRAYTKEWDEFSDRWSTYEYVEYTYDSIGNLSAETGFDYDSYEMTSSQTYQLVYFYNEQQMLAEVVEYVEGWQTGVFVPERRIEYAYDESSDLAGETLYSWDYDFDNWLEDSRKLYSNEISGNQLQEIVTQSWDEQWINLNKSVFLTENEILPGEVQDRHFIFSFLPMHVISGHVVDNVENSNFTNGYWQEGGGTHYYFTRNWPVGIDQENTSTVKVYPNPASDFLQLETDNLKSTECVVYDLSGRMLICTNFESGLQLDLSELLGGYYLIELRQDGKQVYKGKFIKL
ncbi:T9SS type A sorting domain-containing protein [Maribellus sediminis]|uniref:T9SS type A sorting domain-containing protein n=1 Tax=Maribellus sediminis TaxID=2696285 RepID=UPI00142FABDE|nr:T9SS type A sorting domain-containing protein [Maribellus sediminis]